MVNKLRKFDCVVLRLVYILANIVLRLVRILKFRNSFRINFIYIYIYVYITPIKSILKTALFFVIFIFSLARQILFF